MKLDEIEIKAVRESIGEDLRNEIIANKIKRASSLASALAK